MSYTLFCFTLWGQTLKYQGKHLCFWPSLLIFQSVLRSHLPAVYLIFAWKMNSSRNHFPFQNTGRPKHRHVHERRIDFLVRVNISAPDDKKLAISICQDFLVRSNDCVDQCWIWWYWSMRSTCVGSIYVRFFRNIWTSKKTGKGSFPRATIHLFNDKTLTRNLWLLKNFVTCMLNSTLKIVYYLLLPCSGRPTTAACLLKQDWFLYLYKYLSAQRQ